jgi:hypothetical protein
VCLTQPHIHYTYHDVHDRIHVDVYICDIAATIYIIYSKHIETVTVSLAMLIVNSHCLASPAQLCPPAAPLNTDRRSTRPPHRLCHRMRQPRASPYCSPCCSPHAHNIDRSHNSLVLLTATPSPIVPVALPCTRKVTRRAFVPLQHHARP